MPVAVEHAQALPVRRQVMQHLVRRLLTAAVAVQPAAVVVPDMPVAVAADMPAAVAADMPVAGENN